MINKVKIDGIDKIIIKNLVKDARTPISTIAKEVGNDKKIPIIITYRFT